ncbi:MAG: septum formation initiator family protein [Muribaculaceae bacterium]|nr:septum formation initiator family protein [Muribaculaceae bacterium]
MSGKIKKMNFWVRRRSHIALILILGLVVVILFFNEDTSYKLNMEYQAQINALQREIKECEDSAAFYRARRQALMTGTEELEHIAREEYHMQKASEDVYILTD